MTNGNLALGVCVGLLLATTAAAGTKMDPALAARLDGSFKAKKYAVLAQDGVPARAKGDGILDKSVTLQVQNGGTWKQKRFLGIADSDDITANLDKGEMLKVEGYKAVKDGLNLVVDTVKTHDAGFEWKSGKGKTRGGARFDYLRTTFEFRFDEQYLTDTPENHAYILAAVEKYLKLFDNDTEAEAFTQPASAGTAEIKLGMKEADVRQALGAPKRRVDLGAKVRLFYDDMTIVLQDGAVADVESK